MTAPESKKPRFGSSSLARRFQTVALLLPLVLLAVYSTLHWPLYILVGIISLFASLELKKLMGFPQTWPIFIALASWVTATLWFAKEIAVPWVSLGALLIGTGAVWLRAKRNTPHFLDYLSLGWIAGPIACAVYLQRASFDISSFFSPNLLLLALFPLWIGDTLAYFIGKNYGKNPLAPKISPNKTWEGAIANALGCLISATVVAVLLNVDWWIGAIIGILTGVLGQMGDLLQSALKRATDAKDSGSILPGHGGVLDRIDSFLLSSVPSTVVLWYLLPWLFHVKHG